MLFISKGHKFILWNVILLLIANSAFSKEYYTEKPAFIKSCRIFEPGFTKCSTESVQGLMDQLVKGLNGFDKPIAPLDPLNLDYLSFKQDNNDAVSLRANLSEIKISGFSKMQIKESRVNKKNFSWDTKIYIPNASIEGKYKMTGRILLIPLNGNGDFSIDIQKLDIIMHTKTKLYEKGNFTFYDILDTRVAIDIQGLKVYFHNLFNGKSKEVERSTNQFFNENWRDLLEALRPLIVNTIQQVMRNILKDAFDVIPANFLVEDIPTSKQLYKQR